MQLLSLTKYLGNTSNSQIINTLIIKSLKILYVKALQKKFYSISINTWVIIPGIEQQGAWFLEVAQHQLVSWLWP